MADREGNGAWSNRARLLLNKWPAGLPDWSRGAGESAWLVGAAAAAGVLLPAAAWLGEAGYRPLASSLVDPFPTLVHLLLAGAVPAINGWALGALLTSAKPGSRRLGFALGFALCIAGFYALAMALPGWKAGVFHGGLWATAAAGGAVGAGAWLRARLAVRAELRGRAAPPLRYGAALALLALAALELPAGLTSTGLLLAASDNDANHQRGVRLLRFAGDPEAILHACASEAPVVRGSSSRGILSFLGEQLDSGQVERAHFRATGRTCAQARLSVQPVAGAVIKASVMEGEVSSRTLSGRLVWKLALVNLASSPQSPWLSILLPRGGIVTQTLGAVRLSASGPDRILLRHPLIEPGRSVDLQLEMTYPLELLSPDRLAVMMPRVTDSNFALSVRPQVRLRSDAAPTDREVWSTLRSGGELIVSHEPARSTQSPSQPLVFEASWQGPFRTLTEDPGGAGTVIQEVVRRRPSPFRNVTVVVDGSATSEPWFGAIGAELKAWTDRCRDCAVDIAVAADTVARVGDDFELYDGLALVGGADAAPALVTAIENSADDTDLLLWITGPQPVSRDKAISAIEHALGDRPTLELAVLESVPGANRILESRAIAERAQVVRGYTDPARVLHRLLDGGAGLLRPLVVERRRQAAAAAPTAVAHDERPAELWAAARADALLQAGDKVAAVNLARRYGIVATGGGVIAGRVAAPGFNPSD